MAENNMILNRLFTQNAFLDMIHFGDTSIFDTVIKRYINDPEDKSNGTIISEIYSYMANKYRNEYFYQNTLLNKLLLGKHSVNTTTALTQIPISKSKADFILINGKAVVYEIKTALDTFERLNTQVRDYYKAFSHVCVVTSEHQFEQACEILKDTNVGVYCLTAQETISMTKRKEPITDDSQLDHTTMFKILHKSEFENIINKYYGELPKVSQVFYFGECLEQFSEIPIAKAYNMFLKELKKRNKIEICNLNKIPYELKSLIYFLRPNNKDWEAINQFLINTHK